MAPFLTALDSRAEVKGSRDPLGIQSIWSHFGRHLVGNLATVTTPVRDFTVLLLGFHFAEQVEESGGKATFVDTFLQWEQLAKYARFRTDTHPEFRGIERVKKFLNEDSARLIGADALRASVYRYLSTECVVACLPDGRVAAADNVSGRLTRWVNKNYQGGRCP
jgi:hypothetical protein